MHICPSLVEFQCMVKECNIIPLYTNISADTETPISLYLRLVGKDKGFLLESAESGKNFGRYSFIGIRPFMEVIGRAEGCEFIDEAGKAEMEAGNPFDLLQTFLNKYSMLAEDQIPFLGGGVGYFAYDAISTIERVRDYQLPNDFELMRLLFCRVILILDHLKHTLKIVYLATIDSKDSIEDAYLNAMKELSAIVAEVSTARPVNDVSEILKDKQGQLFVPPDANSESAQNFMAMVAKAKEYICAGDAFQIVLSQQFKTSLRQEPFQLYRKLRQVNPSPYMFYLNFSDKKIIGASPEMLVKVDNGKVLTCPIAGTRQRGVSEVEDDILAQELLADEKEQAEHAMLVDLGRNDLGRISQPGTVNVDKYMQVEKFSHVMHLVSLVSGKLEPGYTALNALRSCFPAGTVSGAPKVRAMEIIHELEGDLRGAYAGAVGYLDFRGNMDTCITIRTMVVKGNEVAVRVGAGIVYDSVPEKEYQEILHKGRALFKLMED